MSMDLITLDFETYYDKDYSLSKLTTEEYVRDPRFEVIGVGIKLNDKETEWASGTHKQLREYLQTNFPWENAMVLAHNTMFDGAILNWIFNCSLYSWKICLQKQFYNKFFKIIFCNKFHLYFGYDLVRKFNWLG